MIPRSSKSKDFDFSIRAGLDQTPMEIKIREGFIDIVAMEANQRPIP